MGVLLFLASFASPNAVSQGVLCVVGLLLTCFGYVRLKNECRVTADGVWVFTWSSQRFLKFSDITRCEVSDVSTKGGGIRRMILEHPEGGVIVNSQVEDFSVLEQFVVKHVRPEIVRYSNL